MNRRMIEEALLMLATGAALAGIPLTGIAQDAPTSAIRQMIEMQLNSHATEPAPAGVPGMEASRLILPAPVRGTQAPRPAGTAGTAAPMPAAARPLP